VQRAPGIPHALCFPGRRIHARLGRIAPRDRGLACCCHCEERSDEAIQSLVAALDCFARPLRNYLNCGIVGALMRGGAIGATLEAFPIPLGSTNISSAPIVAAFGRPPPKCPIAAEPPPRPPPPPPRANEAAGVAKTMNNAIATFTEVFDMGSSTNIH